MESVRVRGSAAQRCFRPGAEWPLAYDGRPLSFLAGVDLGELPAGDGRPKSGWWLYFGWLGENENGTSAFWEPQENAGGALARLFFVEGEPAPAEVPAALREEEWCVLKNRPVVWEPVLTLPHGYDPAERLGLDAAGYDALQQVLYRALQPDQTDGTHWATEVEALPQAARQDDAVAGPQIEKASDTAMAFGTIDRSSWRDPQPREVAKRERAAEPPDRIWGHHWIGGHVPGPEDPPAGSVLLLALQSDSSIGFEFLDAGVVTFRIPADALARRDWRAVTIDPESS